MATDCLLINDAGDFLLINDRGDPLLISGDTQNIVTPSARTRVATAVIEDTTTEVILEL